MRTIIISCTIIAAFIHIARAQSLIQIGDRMPDLTFDRVWNHPKGNLSFSALRGKLVILDFWTVGCKSCIAAFPKMQQLQDRFGDKIQVILVTSSPEDKVRSLLARNGMDRTIHLPQIMGDTVLTQLFEFRTVPTHAWIDQTGHLAYFTAGTGATGENIAAFLSGTDIDLPYKREYRDFNSKVSFMAEGGGRQQRHIRSYSMILGRIDDDGGGLSYQTDSATGIKNGLRIPNWYIADLYKEAYAHALDTFVHRAYGNYGTVILEVDTPEYFMMPERPTYRWRKDHTYSYEVMMPPERARLLYPKMQADLDGFFGLRSGVEERVVRCLVLKRRSHGSEGARYPKKYKFTDNDTLFVAHRTPMYFLLREINNRFGKQGADYYPVVNETGISSINKINVSLAGNLLDLKVFRKELQAHGFDLIMERRKIKVIMIRDN